MFDHLALSCRHTESFPKELFRANDGVTQELREKNSAYTLAPYLALLVQGSGFAEIRKVVADA